MKSTRNSLPFIVAAFCFRCLAADDGFYRSFLSASDTNNLDTSSLKSPSGYLLSPLVVDTNNTAAKLTNVVIHLDKLTGRGELADIHLGMTMDELVARWGKPKGLHPNCDGGHRFNFSDCALVFLGNSLDKVRFQETAVFDRGLSARSKLREWLQILGPPTLRNDRAYHSSLVYETRGGLRTVLLLTFTSDGDMEFPPTLYLNPELTNWFKPSRP
jgi:hypothetical protein